MVWSAFMVLILYLGQPQMRLFYSVTSFNNSSRFPPCSSHAVKNSSFSYIQSSPFSFFNSMKRCIRNVRCAKVYLNKGSRLPASSKCSASISEINQRPSSSCVGLKTAPSTYSKPFRSLAFS